MNRTQELIHKFQRQLPESLRRGQVLSIGRRLGLGERSVAVWLAHHCQRVRVGAQWRYPRDYVLAHLLDKAGLLEQAGMSSVGADGIQEGAPGSLITNLR